MNNFRIRSGEFVGIIIPGVILCLNLILIFWNYFIDRFKILSQEKPFDLTENGLLFILFLIVSYIFGVVLRLLSPDIPDGISGCLRSISATTQRGIKIVVKDAGSVFPLREYFQPFPYIKYFYEVFNLKGIPNVKEFEKIKNKIDISNKSLLKSYKSIIKKAINFLLFSSLTVIFLVVISKYSLKNAVQKIGIYAIAPLIFFIIGLLNFIKIDDENREYPIKFSPKDFLNYCKLTVINKSPLLGEEILFAEGLSRMFSGSFYAFMYSILILIGYQTFKYKSAFIALQRLFDNEPGPNTFLLIGNAILLLMITWGIRHVRIKESSTVFASYCIVMENEDTSQQMK